MHTLDFAQTNLVNVKTGLRKLGLTSLQTSGPPGPPGPPGLGAVTSVVAAENIPAFAVVTSDGRNGNSATLSQRGKVIGVSLTAINTGFAGDVQSIGQIVNGAWSWSPGDIVFLNGTSLSTSVPGTGYVQLIGTAQNANTLVVELGPAILL